MSSPDFRTRSVGGRGNVLSPSPIDSDDDGWILGEIRNGTVGQIALCGVVKEVAATALFLVSDTASFAAWAELYVDGGRHKARRQQ